MDSPSEESIVESEITIPEGCSTLDSPVTGSVWKIGVQAGDLLSPASTALILEAMKMEVPLDADEALQVVEVLVAEGASVRAGQALVVVRAGN